MINYKIFQKLKLLRNGELNDLTIILIISSCVSPNSQLLSGTRRVGFFFFNFLNVGRAKKRFEFGITNYDAIINYHLSRKLKLLENGELNLLNITVTKFNGKYRTIS